MLAARLGQQRHAPSALAIRRFHARTASLSPGFGSNSRPRRCRCLAGLGGTNSKAMLRSTSSLLNKDAPEIEPCKIRGTTQPLVSRTGAGRQGNIFSFRSREKNVLDFSSPRTWLTTPVESTKRSRQVFGTSDPAECAVNCFYRTH